MVRSRSIIATAPGATIKEQLIDRGMSQKEFAARMNMSEKHISKLINGSVQLTPETAVRLEMVLGAPAKFWNNLEIIYREKVVKAEAENAMDADAETANLIPYSQMAGYRWVPATEDSREKVEHLRKYFEVVNLSLLGDERITRIACHRLEITKKSDLALLAWAQEAKILARDIHTEPINVKRFTSMLPEFRKMTVLKPDRFCPRMKKGLADCGVALVFLPHLKGAFLQGATFMDGNKVVVGITSGEKKVDGFWNDVFHEFAHVALGHISQTNGISNEDERNADQWSKNMLIQADDFEEFRENSDYSEKNVLKFAEKQGIAPGIVVGRLQSEGLIKHNMLNGLKEEYMIIQ